MQIKHRSQLNELLNHFNMFGDSAEVGVAEGRYSEQILSWGVPKLFMIDAWQKQDLFGDANFPQEWHNENYEEAKERVKRFGDKAIMLKGLSVEMANQIPDESLCFVYLDACHTYEAVLSDLNAYLPKLKQGGIMAGHDFLSKDYGVEKAVYDFCEQKKYEVNTIPELIDENASFWFQKK
jgi:hypothetical protein